MIVLLDRFGSLGISGGFGGFGGDLRGLWKLTKGFGGQSVKHHFGFWEWFLGFRFVFDTLIPAITSGDVDQVGASGSPWFFVIGQVLKLGFISG